MITALILINVKRDAVNATAQALLEIPSVAEVVTERMIALDGITRTQTMMAFKAYSRADLEQAWDIGVK